MAYIIDSVGNYQQQIVDHFKADEQRRANFQKHLKNSRYREVMVRSRAPTGPGAPKRDGRQVHGPPQGGDPIEYYRKRLGHTRISNKEGSQQLGSKLSAPEAEVAPESSHAKPQRHGASTYARSVRPWHGSQSARRTTKLDADSIRETLKGVFAEASGARKRAVPYPHYDGRVTAGLPLRLDEMEFVREAHKSGMPQRLMRGTQGFTEAEAEALKLELAAGGIRSRSPDSPGHHHDVPHMPRPPTEAKQQRAQSAPAHPPDHTRRVKPTWKPNTATAHPLPSDGSSAVGRWASASPWRERPGEYDGNVETPLEEWPLRTLQPRQDQEREVGT